MDGELTVLARMVKAKARKVEREAHELRRLASQLEDAATDTSVREDTDADEDAAARSAYAAA